MAVDLGHFEKLRAIAASARAVVLGGVRLGAASQVTAFDPTSNKKLWTADVPAHVTGACIVDDVALCALADGSVRALKLSGGGEAWSVAAHTGAVTAVAALPDGSAFATVGVDGALRLWGFEKRDQRKEYLLSTMPLRAVAVSPDGASLAAAGDDSVVRAVTLANDERREMSGHDGAVRALVYTPRDGRVASGGEDGTVRFHYLQGPIEHETRGTDDSGHAGGVTALVFAPTPPLDKDGEDPGDRLFSAGVDGNIRMWRLGDRRKPRSFSVDGSAVFALAIAPAERGSTGVLGSLVAGGDGRALARFALDQTGTPAATPNVYTHGLAALEAAFNAQRPARESAVRTLAALDEIEGRALLAKFLSSDRDAAVRALAASEIEAKGRRDLLPAIRDRLGDDAWNVRAAAYSALRALYAAAPLSAIRAAAAARAADVRRRALAELPSVGKGSPLARPLAMGALTDADRAVRFAALEALVRLDDAGSAAPMRAAFSAGPADVRAEVLGRVAAASGEMRAELASMLARALDDEAPDVRRAAFLASVLSKPALAVTLFRKDGDLARAFGDLTRRVAELALPAKLPVFGPEPAAAEPSDGELAKARTALLGSVAAAGAAAALLQGKAPSGAEAAPLTESELAPLVAAAACRSSDTALAGAAALAALGDGRALGALLQVSRDPDVGLRKRTAFALATLRGAHAEKRIAWMLDDANADVRAAAYDALAKVHADKPAALVDLAMRSSQQDIRVRALSLLLREAEKPGSDVSGLLEDAIEDESAEVRLEALRTLWTLRKGDEAAVVERALAARFPDVRKRAVDALAARKKDEAAHQKLAAAIADRAAEVALAAYEALVENAGKSHTAAHLAAIASVHPVLRERGARGAVHSAEADVRSALVKLLEDESSAVRVAAIEALDRLVPKDDAPLRLGLQSSHLDLRVRAAELCAVRGTDALIDPMRALLLDKELKHRVSAAELAALRQRASSSLATLAAPSTIRFLVDLLKDDDGFVREQAARGLANACRRGDEGALLDALGHADLAVRSWAAEGLARLGDARALPVLVGSLRHPHPPIRVGAVLAFAALGPEGYGGMLQGLEDVSEEVQEHVLLVVLARDLRAARRGEAPELLAAALSASRPEVRFAAARALELRHDRAAYLSHLVAAILPPKPEKASDMKDWPAEPKRSHIAVGLAEALAGDRPEQRYAASQALRLRTKPRDFFREAEKVAKPRLASSPWIADNTPRAAEESDVEARAGWLRKLFADGAEGAAAATGTPDRELLALAFGAYVGMIRTDTDGGDESHRVRRDAVDRIVEHATAGHVARDLALAPVVRALGDAHHLVRKAALAGLQKVLAPDAETPLAMALASPAADVARAALDELARGGAAARPRIATALGSAVSDVRRYAFELLEKLSPKGSLEPLLWALGSEHTDIRLGVLDRLASAADPRVTAALGKAAESEHPDVRLRAAELLAERRDDRAADVLSTLLRSDDSAVAHRAEEGLVTLGTSAAADVLAARAEEVESATDRARLAEAIGRLAKTESAVRALAAMLRDDDASVRNAALSGGLDLVGRDNDKRDHALAAVLLAAAARAKDPSIRLTAATELAESKDSGADAVLASLLGDRDSATRAVAAKSYATRVVEKAAPVEPLNAIVAAGTRDLLLSAAEGVAARSLPAALRPLILFARAGELEERARALLALGYLADKRAFNELQSVLTSGTPEEPTPPELTAAAIEALGRIASKLTDVDMAKRARDAVDDASRSDNSTIAEAAARGLRHIGGDVGRSRLEILVGPGGSSSARVEAAKALGEIGDPSSETALAVAIADYDDELSEAAHKALEKIFPKDRTRVALHALTSHSSDVSEPAAAYLATEGDATELLPRLATLEDETLAERLRYGLLRRASLPTSNLVTLLGNAAPAAREGAAWLLGARASTTDADGSLAGALAKAASTASEKFARDDDSSTAEAKAWARALWAAGRHKLAAAAPTARAALASTAPTHVRVEAVRMLGRLALAEDHALLTTALADRDAAVRAAAAEALAAAAPNALSKTIAEGAVDPDAVARFAGSSAEMLAAPTARTLALRTSLASHETAALASVAKNASADRAARLDAVSALGRIGGSEAASLLQTLAFDKASDADFRKAAYRALRRARRIDQRVRSTAPVSAEPAPPASEVTP
ncbi:MAG: HEAT repeat domain-containing protein [Polyangiaceae bacterium]|nr:HEAT repeat domain-containing protein [Polyangiaceae bacterium]